MVLLEGILKDYVIQQTKLSCFYIQKNGKWIGPYICEDSYIKLVENGVH